MKASDLTPDPSNANLGTERGASVIDYSLKTFGFGQPVFLDRENTLIAGNKTSYAGSDMDVEIVDVAPNQILVHVRDDLDINDPKARGLAYALNRTQELSSRWDTPAVVADYNPLGMEPYWRPAEIEAMANAPIPEDPALDDERAFWPVIEVKVPQETYKDYRDLLGEGEEHEAFLQFLARVASGN